MHLKHLQENMYVRDGNIQKQVTYALIGQVDNLEITNFDMRTFFWFPWDREEKVQGKT